jgi:hypothetical protein
MVVTVVGRPVMVVMVVVVVTATNPCRREACLAIHGHRPRRRRRPCVRYAVVIMTGKIALSYREHSDSKQLNPLKLNPLRSLRKMLCE